MGLSITEYLGLPKCFNKAEKGKKSDMKHDPLEASLTAHEIAAGTDGYKGHLRAQWLKTLSDAHLHFKHEKQLEQIDNPWIQKDVASLLKAYLREAPQKNFVEQLHHAFTQTDDGLLEIVAHLRVCPECAGATLKKS